MLTVHLEQLIGGNGHDNFMVNNPRLLTALHQARIEAARQNKIQIVSNINEHDQEEEKNAEVENGGIIGAIWNFFPVRGVRWVVSSFFSAIVFIKDLFFAKEDTSGMISGEEFKRVFRQRLEQLGI